MKESDFDKLDSEYNYWDEHDEYGLRDWIDDVVEEGTRLGYWDWVQAQIDGVDPTQ